jgi:ribonuclease HI
MIPFQPQVIIYTDGSSRGNPGPGGYGVVLMAGQLRKEMSGGFRLTTNNRMELLAVITGLEALKKPLTRVVVYSDSKYVVDAIEKGWLHGWMKNNFKGGKKNPDLWRRFHAIYQKHHVKFVWVKGHANNPYNNRCDELATSAADNSAALEVDTEFENNQG